MFKKIIFLLAIILPNALFAYDCSQYKYDPDIDIKITVNDAKIKKSDENLSGKLGFCAPVILYGWSARTVFIPVHGGYCVSLRGLDIDISEDFDITIDKRLKENSCAYNLVLKHEQDHMNVYKNTIQDNFDFIKNSVLKGVKDIEPEFIKNIDENPDFNKKINDNDFVKKIKTDIMNKIKAENEKIDERGDTYYIWKCDDFYKEVKNENIVID